MTTKANRHRAQDARLTLSHFTVEAEGLDVAITDQLTNLMHLCGQHHIDIDQLWSNAFSHYASEVDQ